MKSPAFKLQGLDLEGGWTVGKIQEPPSGATGSVFSCCYEVSDAAGRKAFLKALDFSRALRQPDFVFAVNAMTQAYIFERNLLAECRRKNMDRVVKAIGRAASGAPVGTYVSWPR